METIVTSLGEGFVNYNDFYEWAKSFDDNPDDPDFDAWSYLGGGDPDILHCDGNKLYFISNVMNGKRYVLTHEEVDTTEREMLTLFFQEDFTKYFELLQCSWEAFEATERAIAFRDGAGYVYTFWRYTTCKPGHSIRSSLCQF